VGGVAGPRPLACGKGASVLNYPNARSTQILQRNEEKRTTRMEKP
jgi:hypothetical protein